MGDNGLSPRVRGNHRYGLTEHGLDGSIPARAGQPCLRDELHCLFAVYPRACGATSNVPSSHCMYAGLSPRVRGNHHLQRAVPACAGSIPARAGQPTAVWGRPAVKEVYPRACGATRLMAIRSSFTEGLSPRVRGNLHEGIRRVQGLGSIPARAGQPSCMSASRAVRAVYPRACGATSLSFGAQVTMMGLSPRVRGNPGGVAGEGGRLRSIPARAGQPPAPARPAWTARVYPRACGATVAVTRGTGFGGGLSPRVRGNHLSMPPSDSSASFRSIPARAGQPTPCAFHLLPSSTVYPRACGATSHGNPIH